MPRRARLDTPGILRHAMVRGIERRRIVDDVADFTKLVRYIHLIPLRAKLVKNLSKLDSLPLEWTWRIDGQS